MATDLKYGRVTLARGTVGEEEPVVVVRAQDQLAVPMLEYYLQLCEAAGSPPHHLDVIRRSIAAFSAWQAEHHTQIPRSDGLAST